MPCRGLTGELGLMINTGNVVLVGFQGVLQETGGAVSLHWVSVGNIHTEGGGGW